MLPFGPILGAVAAFFVVKEIEESFKPQSNEGGDADVKQAAKSPEGKPEDRRVPNSTGAQSDGPPERQPQGKGSNSKKGDKKDSKEEGKKTETPPKSESGEPES